MKCRVSLAAVLASAGLWGMADETPGSLVKWIRPDEPFKAGLGKDRYYRTTVDVREGLTNAVAYWWFDDHGALFVDGCRIPGGSSCLKRPADLTAALGKSGRHALAVQSRNLAGVGGVCLSLALAYADGKDERVYTSDRWRCAMTAVEGWKTPAFDDSTWPVAKVHDDVTTDPWIRLADMTRLMLPGEKRAFEAERIRRAAELDRTIGIISAEPKPQCRVVYEKGRARLDIGGRMFEPILYNTSQSWHDDNPRLRRQAAYFRDAGVHLYGLGVQTADVWKEDGSIDFAPAEAVMKSALAIDSEARFFFSINTVLPPRWWAETHPDELVGYQTCEVNLKEKECLRNCAAGSAASSVWRRDIADFERRLVEHLEASPFASRIFAYRTDWGINHEWHYYGMRGYFADCGKAMTAAFRDALRRTYGNDLGRFRAAWNDETVTFETAEVPSPEVRLRQSAGALRDPIADRAVIDYERCHARMLRELLVRCNRTIKDACGGRALVGNYGGYYFGMPEMAEGWHLENDRALDDSCIDFQCSPQVYGAGSRKAGAVQYARCLLEGLRGRGKLSIQEADNSTTFSESTYNRWSRDTEGDIAILARDFVQTLCWGCGFWYFDFGIGWYATPEFGAYFKKILPIRSEPADCSSVSEVLVVGDYESVMFSHVRWPPPPEQLKITDQVNELGGAGAPFDSASVADLASGRLKDYKVYVFPNLFYVTPEKERLVERLRTAGKRLIWLGPAGAIGPEGRRAGGIAKAGEVVEPCGVLKRDALRKLYRKWGVHVYNDDPDAAVYACASYVGLHNAKSGRETLRLPHPARVLELYPERRTVGESLREFSFDVKGPATTLFKIEKQ